MITEQLQIVNKSNLDLYKVVQTAARLNALNGSSILPERLQEVIDICIAEDLGDNIECVSGVAAEMNADIESEIQTEVTETDPSLEQMVETLPARVFKMDVTGAAEMARDMGTPRSPNYWDSSEIQYWKQVSGKELPGSEEITEYFGTWEAFWEGAGFDVADYTAKEVIDLTLEQLSQGAFTRKECDDRFPATPSGSHVLKVFKGKWGSYHAAVEQNRKKERKPLEMIDYMLKKDTPTKDIVSAIVNGFEGDSHVPDIYKAKSQALYKKIANRRHELVEREKEIEVFVEKKRDAVEATVLPYDTIDAIADNPINGFHFYDGKNKAKMREAMAEDVMDHLVPAAGSARRLKYFGLEGVNFKSYILLQQMLDRQIDPKSSVVTEMKHDIAVTMQTIVDRHEAIEGGEIFRGLTVEHELVYDALEKHMHDSFDIFNLDYIGGWSRSKEKSLERMFEFGMIEDDALVYMTLLNSDAEKSNVKNGARGNGHFRQGYGTDDQVKLARSKVAELCKQYKFKYETVRCESYTDDKEMIVLGFHLQKKKY
jgi:hypothetical protein